MSVAEPKLQSEADIVIRAKKGDRTAFAELISPHERAALAIAFAITADPHSAGDAVQNAFLKAWRRLADLRDTNGFAPWLAGIVRNAARDELRGGRRRERLETTLARSDLVVADGDPAAESVRKETQARLAHALGTLDAVTREIVILRYYEDQSSKQIAALLDLTPAAVDMRLSRARERLRVWFEREAPRAFSAPHSANSENGHVV